MTEPSALPTWDTNETNTSVPGAPRELNGWIYTLTTPEKPPAEVWNYLQNLYYKWFDHIDTTIKTSDYCEDLVNTDDYIASTDSPLLSLSDGYIVNMYFENGNTGTTTLNLNGLGVKQVRDFFGSLLSAGDIVDYSLLRLQYFSGSNSWFILEQWNYTLPGSVRLGKGAGRSISSGTDDVIIGTGSGPLLSTAVSCTFVGANSGAVHTTGGECSFFGEGAGESNITDQQNSYLGAFSGGNNNGSNNTFIGRYSGAGLSVPGVNSNSVIAGRNTAWGGAGGDSNSIIGTNSLIATGFAADNLATLGCNIAPLLTSGDDGVYLGEGSAPNITTGSRNIFIGRDSGSQITAAESDKFVLQNGSTAADVLIEGDFSSGDVEIPNGGLTVTGYVGSYSMILGGSIQCSLPTGVGNGVNLNAGSSSLVRDSSTKRHKMNINPISNTDWFYDVEIVEYNRRKQEFDFKKKENKYLDDPEKELELGVTAEQIEKVNKNLVIYDNNGVIQGVFHNQFIYATIKKVQELRTKQAESDARITDLEESVKGLTAKLNELLNK